MDNIFPDDEDTSPTTAVEPPTGPVKPTKRKRGEEGERSELVGGLDTFAPNVSGSRQCHQPAAQIVASPLDASSSSSDESSSSSSSSSSESDSDSDSDSDSSESEAEAEEAASPTKKKTRPSSATVEVVQPGEEPEKAMYVAATGEGDQKEFVWRVTDDVKVKAKLWKGMVFMDIRKYYDEGRKPTQKGVFLNVEKYEKVMARQEMVTAALKWLEEGGRSKSSVLTGVLRNDSTFIDPDGAVIMEIDKGLKVKVYSFKGLYLVDIRSYFKGNATKKGISLKPDVYFKVAAWKDWSKAVAVVKKVNGLPVN